MDLTKARIFLYAVDSGSLSKAALAFDYTPSGISHMMSSFEDEVGFPLLIRTKTGVMPTSDAQRLIPIIRSQCSWDEQFCQVVSEINGLAQGTLRIGAYSSIANQWLPGVIAAFHKDYPRIHIELLEGVWQEVDGYLHARKVDMAFYGYQHSIRHQWIPLKNDAMVVVAPLGHPLASKNSVRITDLENEPLIMPAFGSDLDVVSLLKEGNVKMDLCFSTLQYYSALSMVEQGLGLMITNELITIGRTNRVKLLSFDPPRSINLGIAVPLENRSIPAVAKFIEYAKAIII